MNQLSRAMHIICMGILTVACAGPVPSPSPDDNASPAISTTAFASPSLEPSASPAPTATSTSTLTPTPLLPTETPVVYPSYEPDPTPEGAMPLRTKVEINPNVIERPGVPPELHDKYWWTPDGDAGQLGTTAQIGLPASERIISVVDGVVLAARSTADGRAVLVLRSFSDGTVIREIPTDMSWLDAVVVGSRVFWAGMATAVDSYKAIDGGVWTTDTNTDDPPIAIVDAGKTLGGALCGRNLMLSSQGTMLAATASCFGWKGWTDVITVATHTVVRRITGVAARDLTDSTYVAWDATPTDGLTYGQGGITAYDLGDDAVRWRFPDLTDVKRFALYDVAAFGNAFVVLSGWDLGDDSESRLTIFNSGTGQHRLLARDPDWDTLSFDRHSSTRGYLVLDYGWEDIAISGSPISILRVVDGVRLSNAFVVDPPFICRYDYCLRDGVSG